MCSGTPKTPDIPAPALDHPGFSDGIILPHKLITLNEVTSENFEIEQKEKYPTWLKVAVIAFFLLIFWILILIL